MSLMTFLMVRICYEEACLNFGRNLLSLKASRTVSKIDDIAGVVARVEEDYGHSRLGLVSLVMVSIV